MRRPSFCFDVRFDLPKLTFQLELDEIAAVFLLARNFADSHQWKNSLPWHPGAAECGRRISRPIHLPYHFVQSNCLTGRLSGSRSRPFGSLPCGRSGRLP